MHEEPSDTIPQRDWTWWRLLGDCAAICAVFLFAAIVTGTAARTFEEFLRLMTGAYPPAPGVEYDGYLFSIVAIGTALICVPFVLWLARRRDPKPWRFLGFKRVTVRAVAVSCAVMLGILVVADVLAGVLDLEQPEFMIEIYTSARSPWLLLAGAGIAAPLLEEVVFRGYLFSALRALHVPLWAVALLTSLAFAALHTQYDVYFMFAIFATGMALVWARIRFDSVIPSIAMHIFNNTIALIAVHLLQ